MILVDTNIIMYAAGTAHPNKLPSVRFLERVARGELNATVNAELLQEILHRYRAIKRWNDGRQVYDLARQIFPNVIAISSKALDHARQLLDKYPTLMARDALHAAIVSTEKLESICSYDKDFDRVAGLTRIEPEG